MTQLLKASLLVTLLLVGHAAMIPSVRADTTTTAEPIETDDDGEIIIEEDEVEDE